MYYGSPTHQASESIPLTNTSFTDAMTTNPPVGTFNNTATYDAANQYARLTPAINGVNGELNYPFNPGASFDASFQFWAGGGNGADSTYLYAYCGEVATEEDQTCNNGYIIAYDEYHAQFQVFYDGTLIDAVPTTTVGNGTWHNAEIVKVGTRIKMYDNGTLVLDYTDSSRDISGDFFGLGARTGGLNNEHRVRNFTVTHDYTAPVSAPGVSVGSESAVSPSYDALGTWESQQIDLGDVLDWGDGTSGSVAAQVAYSLESANDTLQLEARTGATNGDLSSATYQTIATVTSGSSLTLTKADLVGAGLTANRFFQLRATLSQSDNTTLAFCLFGQGSSTMSSFPTLGVSYGVLAASGFSQALATGSIHVDDEDDSNNDGYTPPSQLQLVPIALSIVSSGKNTDIGFAKVR